MSSLTETATFRGDDEVCLVEASLACSLCLSGDVEWSLRTEEWDAGVDCRCEPLRWARSTVLSSS